MLIWNAWTGSTCEIDSSRITNIEDLKAQLAKDENIDASNLLILTYPQGALLKDLNCTSAFLFDKTWVLEEPPTVDNENGLNDFSDKLQKVIDATQLVSTHMSFNLENFLRQLNRVKEIMERLRDDVALCANWQQYYTALEKIPQIGLHLTQLLDNVDLESNFAKLDSLWHELPNRLAELDNTVSSLKSQLNSKNDSTSDNLEKAHQSLLKTLKEAGQFQSHLVSELRAPLSKVNADLKVCEDLKFKVAQVIDLPFLYGVLLIENSRRSKWLSDFSPIWSREKERRQEWFNHYCNGLLSTLVHRLDIIGNFGLTNLENVPQVGEIENVSGHQNVAEYLQQLDALGLKDVSEDLRKELSAMKKQFAKSMSASISSLLPQSVVGSRQMQSSIPTSTYFPSSIPSSADSQTAAYEARISKLETLLMQSRLGSKTHEIDVIRAETRAEAKAEAKAEILSQKQQQRIEELEAQNRELATRLFRYSTGLEVVLNSMGLQTSRVDPETGANVYRINRVKGISRRVNLHLHDLGNTEFGHDESGHGDSASASMASDSNKSSQTPGSSIINSDITTMSLEKLLDQTCVDNHVLFEAVRKRFGDVEKLARKLQVENRKLKDSYRKLDVESRQRVALYSFRPEDLILFLPTRDPRRKPNPWAAFNAGAPYYFLHPNHAEQLKNREYLIARASSIERHVVGENSENPFDLPNNVEWFLISIHDEWDV